MSKPEKKRRLGDNAYLKYSGMAFQMAATIVVFVLLGRWLDGYFITGQLLTVVFALLGVFGGLYVALKDFF